MGAEVVPVDDTGANLEEAGCHHDGCFGGNHLSVAKQRSQRSKKHHQVKHSNGEGEMNAMNSKQGGGMHSSKAHKGHKDHKAHKDDNKIPIDKNDNDKSIDSKTNKPVAHSSPKPHAKKDAKEGHSKTHKPASKSHSSKAPAKHEKKEHAKKEHAKKEHAKSKPANKSSADKKSADPKGAQMSLGEQESEHYDAEYDRRFRENQQQSMDKANALVQRILGRRNERQEERDDSDMGEESQDDDIDDDSSDHMNDDDENADHSMDDRMPTNTDRHTHSADEMGEAAQTHEHDADRLQEHEYDRLQEILQTHEPRRRHESDDDSDDLGESADPLPATKEPISLHPGDIEDHDEHFVMTDAQRHLELKYALLDQSEKPLEAQDAKMAAEMKMERNKIEEFQKQQKLKDSQDARHMELNTVVKRKLADHNLMEDHQGRVVPDVE
jgi:hypothetical protein